MVVSSRSHDLFLDFFDDTPFLLGSLFKALEWRDRPLEYTPRAEIAQELIHLFIAWPAVGILTLIAIPYWFVQRHWTSWNEEEMQRALRLESSPRSSAGPVLSGLCMLEFLIAGLIYGEVAPFWVLFPLFVVPVYVFMVLEPSVHHNARDTEATPARSSGTPAESPISSVDALLSGALAVLFMAALPFSWGLALWIAVVWIAGRVSDGVIAGFRPDAISSFEAGGTAVLLAAVGWAVHFWWSRRARAAH